MKTMMAALLVCAGCSASPGAMMAAGGGSGGGGGSADSGIPDAGPAPVRTLELAVDGDPNGLIWVPETKTLYIADDDNNRILTWTDEGGFGEVLALPTGPANGAGLGQITRLADGTLLTTWFGYGTDGAVAEHLPDGGTALVANLDKTKRRIGIVSPNGTDIYDSYFVKGATGAVAKVTLDGSEVDISTGFQKPVGLLVIGTTLYVSDQSGGGILKCTLPACTDLGVFAHLSAPDLLSLGPNGVIYSGSADGNLYQIDPAGNVTTYDGTFTAPRGTSYDAVNRRLFVADHVPAPGVSALRIVPIDE